MANDAYTQQALAKDSQFLPSALGMPCRRSHGRSSKRIPPTEYHKERAAYAQKVTGSGVSVGSGPSMMASQLAPSFVNRPNVFNFDTTYRLHRRHRHHRLLVIRTSRTNSILTGISWQAWL